MKDEKDEKDEKANERPDQESDPKKDTKVRLRAQGGAFLKTDDQGKPYLFFLCTWSTDICLSFTGGTHERGHDGQMYETEPPLQAQFVPVRADLAQCGYFRAEGEEWIERMRNRNKEIEGGALSEFTDFEALVVATVKHNERLTLDGARFEQEAFDTVPAGDTS